MSLQFFFYLQINKNWIHCILSNEQACTACCITKRRIIIMKNKRTCDYIAEAIQNEILSGRMEAGQPLRQEDLSEKLGYSRMPVREALQILEEQGLVRRLATRHVVVADFSERNIEEIFDMVGNVEKKALKDLAEQSFDWEFEAEDDEAEKKFHEFVYGTITNGLFRRLLETSADCYIRFAAEETGKTPEQKKLRRDKLETVYSAYCRKDNFVMEVALEEYYKLLTENVKNGMIC